MVRNKTSEARRTEAEALGYPPCQCGHRYDHHTDPGDPRQVGCWSCGCREYVPVALTTGGAP